MEIVVLGVTIETQEIFDIKEVEHDKRYFLNREAGFIIYLIDKKPLVFKERIPYETTNFGISSIKQKWSVLQDEVFEKWQKDKSELQQFNLKN